MAGEDITLAKLNLNVGDTLYDKERGSIAMPDVPEPMFSLALVSKARGDEDKIIAHLQPSARADPCLEGGQGTDGETISRG